MNKHNVLVTVNGISKSRAQWAKELGVTKGAISLRESKGESASSAIENIIGTMHTRKIREHYAHAKEKHPYFCDTMRPDFGYSLRKEKKAYACALKSSRDSIVHDIHNGTLSWDKLLDCEIWEMLVAMVDGDAAHAVEECYYAIAVLLRTIDVLEGRQKLGKPEKEGKAK